MTAALTLDAPARLRRPGMARGIAVSLALHALLIFGYRLSAPTAAPELPARESMTVWLQPPRPPAPVVAEARPEAVKPVKQVPPRERNKEVEPARASQPAPATSAEAPAAAQAITAPPVAGSAPDPLYAQPQQQPKQFDMTAALKTARKVANEKDPARAGLPVAQLDDHPLYPEQATKLERDIAGAKRPTCLNPGGNLLTPLFWLLDKKDHGCKL